MNLKNLIIVALCCIGNILIAQTVKGTVKNASGDAVPFANITVLNSSKEAVSDKDGNFSLDLSIGNYQIQFSAVDYAPKVQPIEVTNQTLTIDVNLLDNTQTLGEVVVTADKIEANVQKTPLAITVLNAKKIQDYRVWSFSDITALAPSTFSIEHGNSTSATFLNIRGAMGFTAEQAVATYVDGVYQFDFFSAPLNFNNVESIEILRGPQGTLYGRNAFSGVVNITTKKPTNKTSGFAELDFGNYGQQRYSLGFNTPLIKDKLFINGSVQLSKRGSVYENPTLNTKNFDSRQSLNGNIGLKYLVSNKWIIDLTARTESNEDKGAYPWVATDSIARNAPYKAFGNFPNTERRTNTNVAISAKYYGNKFNFTSTTGGIDFHLWYPDKFDFDFTSAKLFSGNNDLQQNLLTQEFRLSSPASADKLKWTVGSFMFIERTKTDFRTYFDEDFAAIDPDAPYTTIAYGKRNNKGIAGYGQATYSFTPQFDVTIGARYDNETRELSQNTALERNKKITQLVPDSVFSKTFNAFTPKINFSYKINNQSLIYASYSKGFRIGGFNFSNTTDRTYNPEKSDNYEVGVKNSLLDNTLKVNVTAFYFQQKDQQVTTTNDGINTATLNVGDMNNLGFEAEVSALPLKNLQIEWTASTSQSKYERLRLFDNAVAEVKNYVGNKAIYNPLVQSMLAVQYGIPFKQSKHNMKAFLRGEFRYLGEYQLNFENTESQKGYGMFNMRAGITSNHVDVAFWVRNLNDVRYIAWGTYGSYTLGSPRMLGVTLTGKF